MTPKRRNSTGRKAAGGREHRQLIRTTDEGTLLEVRVMPGARKTMLAGEENARLKVRLQAPPVEGKANRELTRMLARALDLKRNQVRLIRGESHRDKTVLLAGVALADAEKRLKKALRVE